MLKDYFKKFGEKEDAESEAATAPTPSPDEGCRYCAKSNSDGDFIYETDNWKVFLTADQSYIGRCAVIAKRHVHEISDLNEEEWADFSKVTKKIEEVIRRSFKATMFNWTCLMNDSYKSQHPDPHVHWHVRPRYAKEVEFDKISFWDKEFGHHYNKNRFIEMGDDTKLKIIEKLKDNF